MRKRFVWITWILTFLIQKTSLAYAMDVQENKREECLGKSIKYENDNSGAIKEAEEPSLNGSLSESDNKIPNFSKKEDFLKLPCLNSILLRELAEPFDSKGLKLKEKQAKEILKCATALIPGTNQIHQEGLLYENRHRICNSFIICRKINHWFNESCFSGNLPDLRNRTIVKFGEDGLLYQDNSILNSLDEEGLWALNPKGKMCVFFSDKFPTFTAPIHHSFFFKKGGLAKPVICAGHIKVCNGKIIKINNDSGRYQPSDIQLLLAVKYLFSRGVLDNKVRGELVVNDKNLSLEEMIVIADSLDLK
jgi:hypothetical protein